MVILSILLPHHEMVEISLQFYNRHFYYDVT